MRLVILRGLPGSGKSTRARELVDTLGYKRINKDDLRGMLDSGKWSAEAESLIYLAQMALVQVCMEHGEPVVVDNTHGSERQVNRLVALAQQHGYETTIEVLSTPIETCISRDKERPGSVGERVIRSFVEGSQFFKNLYDKVG